MKPEIDPNDSLELSNCLINQTKERLRDQETKRERACEIETQRVRARE